VVPPKTMRKALFLYSTLGRNKSNSWKKVLS
jgi:hypothetical protein